MGQSYRTPSTSQGTSAPQTSRPTANEAATGVSNAAGLASGLLPGNVGTVVGAVGQGAGLVSEGTSSSGANPLALASGMSTMAGAGLSLVSSADDYLPTAFGVVGGVASMGSDAVTLADSEKSTEERVLAGANLTATGLSTGAAAAGVTTGTGMVATGTNAAMAAGETMHLASMAGSAAQASGTGAIEVASSEVLAAAEAGGTGATTLLGADAGAALMAGGATSAAAAGAVLGAGVAGYKVGQTINAAAGSGYAHQASLGGREGQTAQEYWIDLATEDQVEANQDWDQGNYVSGALGYGLAFAEGGLMSSFGAMGDAAGAAYEWATSGSSRASGASAP